MKKLTINIDLELAPQIVRNIIVTLQYERKSSYPLSRKNIEANIINFISTKGWMYYDDKELASRYGARKDFKEKQEKADKVLTRIFPELNDDSNSLRFIKGL